ncbi:hypothetical protein FQN52_002855 [Onygenales sp. PD_12]|nr:hypothetical protein FQN53_004125 [Emmonsiellopsis sp. PD_33]KAK2792792.1 hypothetical protein FQN52_002855 [Onygenales sp. PD_12]
MSGIQRFLSKREGRSKSRSVSPSKLRGLVGSAIESRRKSATPQHLQLFSLNSDYDDDPAVREENSKIKELKSRIEKHGVGSLKEPQIRYALRSMLAQGDGDVAFELLMILDDSLNGVLRTYTPSIKLLGADNRNGVTCYLDALLFAMFARLDCFEAILYNSFDDEPRRNLSVLLRLWVNMLRSGKLITTDFTRQIQEALAQCGWEAAAMGQQQDVSEAFTFITEKLNLPLLTLKMDIFHTGREEAGDDHKFINERLLEVAIPPDPGDGKPITLEDCLEMYFNNRIEVKRYLERQNTLKSTNSFDSMAKGTTTHVETIDLGTSPISESPISGSFFSKTTEAVNSSSTLPDIPSPRTLASRNRSTSIIRERFIPDDGANENETGSRNGSARPPLRTRKGSIRKEVMMPAWQIFSLIPWYTDSNPSNDSQSAIHFSSRRPILGICLKRYSVLANGNAIRLNTFIDIPVEIGLPHFIKDDEMDNDSPIYGNFKLSLQSVICHRGNSVESGHYIALVRGTALQSESGSPGYCRHWMRFDDLAQEKITLIDIEKALSEESPYLLFYQILPIDGSSEGSDGIPGSQPQGDVAGSRKLFSNPSFEVTVSAASPLEPPPEEEAKGAFQFDASNIPAGVLGTSTNITNNPHATNAVETTVVTDMNSTPSPRGSSTIHTPPPKYQEGSGTGEDKENVPVRPSSARKSKDMGRAADGNTVHGHPEENNSRPVSKAGDKSKTGKLFKDKAEDMVKHQEGYRRTLKKGSEKPERECIVM